MKEVFNSYMNNELNLEKWQKLCIFFLIVIISGIIGWIYEFIFYYFNDGRFTFQGGNFLPWINIYAIGALIIFALSYKYKNNKLSVLLISLISTGLLEYISGALIYKLGNGTRYWNYNIEILNFGNINGFICLRSVLCFGLSGLLLMYIVVPFVIYITKKVPKKIILTISILLFSIIIFDEFYNLIFSKILNTPTSKMIYKRIGIK